MKNRFYAVAAVICSFLMMLSISSAQDRFVSRIDFTKKVLQMSNFKISDVSNSLSFNDIYNPDDMLYIATANKYGIANGYGKNFRPDDYINKEQAFVMLVRAMDEESLALQMDSNVVDSLLNFKDKGQISAWAMPSVAYLVDKGLIESTEDLSPQSLVTTEYADEIYLKCKSYFDSKLSKNGFSAALMLEESSNKLDSYNTYSFKGSMDINTLTETPSVDGLSESESEKLEMTLIQEGVFEKPQSVYSKSTTTIIPSSKEQEEKLQGITNQSCEVYFDGEMYLMKMPGEDFWISMDINPLVKEIQSMAGGHSIGSQALTRNQMKLFGMYSSFDDDAEIDGRDYYAIDVYLDNETFNMLLQDIVNKALEYYSSEIPNKSSYGSVSAEEMEQLKTMVSSMVSNMVINVEYKFYIDKETLDYKFMDIVQNIEMQMGDINSNSNSSGRFEYYDFDKPVIFPEINKSKIKNIPSLIDGAGENIQPISKN